MRHFPARHHDLELRASDKQLHYLRSTDQGRSFSTPLSLLAAGNLARPALTAGDGGLTALR